MAQTEKVEGLCPMDVGINVLNGKWTLHILWRISQGTVRFNALQKSIGNITTRALTYQLRELEEKHIISRQVYAEVPPKVEYSLTEQGKALEPVLKALCEWGTTYMDSVAAL